MAFAIYRYVVAQPAGSGLMLEISDAIETGAMAFLRKEYTILVWFIVVVARCRSSSFRYRHPF